jgi:beta-xylosidase
MSNPIIRHKFTCDPTVLVYHNNIYLYTGHDEAPAGVDQYIMNDWLCFSSTDMHSWVEHPVPLRATDFKWAKGDAYASKVVERDGIFYWYVAVTHASIAGKAIGVAVSSSPTGPFQDKKGSALITSEMLPPTKNEKANLDPSVLIDHNGMTHIFWGNDTCYYAKLKENMFELDGPIRTMSLPNFEEGVHIHKRNDWYYLTYGYGMPEKVAYAMSRNIDGPWEFKGILNELVDNCETNRPAIIDYKNRSYFFYHNGALTGGGSHRRSVCLDELHYNGDHTMKRIVMTKEGIKR